MKLKSIKLVGFKSFVDPTTVAMRGQLVGIVGPNGCGKSNIIDAVRWVMGESSAKQLRGESMADVIFNGSGSRKPLGQASVELVFDNTDHSLGGEYAKYSEIALKRLVTRDGQSNYYLNGSKCRRKDITDIFLGTGLGPRSYAIIGQGTISDLIEARPDQLRVYLEEAAGISKYKERRRETENRIRHTKENLDRLNDLRDELDKQLRHLERQAKTAEKFKQYKSTVRKLRAELLLLRWQTIHQESQSFIETIKNLEIRLEEAIAKQRELESKLEQERQKQQTEHDRLNKAQEQYYGIGTQIATLEQTITHQKERKNQLTQQNQQVNAEIHSLKQQREEATANQDQISQQLSELEPKAQALQEQAQASAQALQSAETKLADWQKRWDEFNTRASSVTQTAEIEQTHIQHHESNIQQAQNRIQKLQQEQSGFDTGDLESALKSIETQQADAKQQVSDKQQAITALNETIRETKTEEQENNQTIRQARKQLQDIQSQYTSLNALQQAALGKADGVVKEWLNKQGLANTPRLAEKIQVEEGWEKALEVVLGQHLEAVCLDNIDSISDVIMSLTSGKVSFVAKATSNPNVDTNANGCLLDKIHCDWDIAAFCENILIADDLTTAMHQLPTINKQQSIVTRDGIWLSRSWLRVMREEDSRSGILQREKALKSLSKTLKNEEVGLTKLEERQTHFATKLQSLETQRDTMQAMLGKANMLVADLNAQQRIKQNKLEQFSQRIRAIETEYQAAKSQITNAQTSLSEARAKWQAALKEMETHAEQRTQLISERDEYQQCVNEYRQTARTNKEQLHQTQITLTSSKTRIESLKETLNHADKRLENLTIKQQQLTQELAQISQPEQQQQQDLEQLLATRLEAEKQLTTAKQKYEAAEHALRNLEKQRQQAEENVAERRQSIESARLQQQTAKVKSDSIQEQITETGLTHDEIINEMPDDAEEQRWHVEVEQLEQKIQRLGAINLAAIEEFQTSSERKVYLDKQNDDLLEAMETLETAIRKIDKETRQRFKETYELVNQGFSEYFPKIFGGGKACLELTGQDLLETGVAVMAQPPGKKNTTIHLLSGGEKALTAIALVFAIFQLNPAPFCMLDEVDAPLDDANVLRYANLVQSMSEHLQFIFISHNKVAIEMAKQLVGVTMREAGASRLVSVDIDEAVAMADASEVKEEVAV